MPSAATPFFAVPRVWEKFHAALQNAINGFDEGRRVAALDALAIGWEVSEYDGRLVTVKSWSVTVSIAALGLGFQQGHAALFVLAALWLNLARVIQPGEAPRFVSPFNKFGLDKRS